MNALEWIRFLDHQREAHGKTAYRIAELAHAAGHPAKGLHVALSRLVRQGILVRYATGVYGLPGAVDVETLVPMLDAGAYPTGHYALFRHNRVLQAPRRITCFTNRRHNRSRERSTPFGTLEFVTVSSRIYAPPARGRTVPPEQALLDYTFLARRRGLDPAHLVAFHGLDRLDRRRLDRLAARYPATVRRTVPRDLPTPRVPAPPREGRGGSDGP